MKFKTRMIVLGFAVGVLGGLFAVQGTGCSTSFWDGFAGQEYDPNKEPTVEPREGRQNHTYGQSAREATEAFPGGELVTGLVTLGVGLFGASKGKKYLDEKWRERVADAVNATATAVNDDTPESPKGTINLQSRGQRALIQTRVSDPQTRKAIESA